MKLSELKEHLSGLKTVSFRLPDGSYVPGHFHITEVGKVSKHFIDCGGTIRREEVISLQLWNANDYDHRLHPEKLQHIIELSEKVLELEDLDLEVEYQGSTIGKYGLDFNSEHFQLTATATDCLAKDNCGIQKPKKKLRLSELNRQQSPCCTVDSSCCQ